jgi:hypothetical protein
VHRLVDDLSAHHLLGGLHAGNHHLLLLSFTGACATYSFFCVGS